MSTPKRPIYIISYTSPLFPAHWSLWIPSSYNSLTKTPGTSGKRIHVTGDALNGFTHEFSRNYDIDDDSRAKTIHFISWVEAVNVVDGDDAGDPVEDVVATDKMEEWALKVEAPGRSLRGVEEGLKSRVQVRNCQSWLREFVGKLVEMGIFDEDALEKVDAVPKN
ncbi:uncharacterized protein LY89DRAFT_660007 [Mollisia scopiformis]|uniref:Uncharacterized protein n=1 Tax=Mollisia scopiformis TaxID=149040 RepID=A0A132B797_MOLSC|nr:uncharacterized protein LY89DRAFT_660007 [Mollisia scopiformis]KUJ07754.1 hypothetical protein LY89DRAFT_660007 [Mollisia scopiformis]